MKKLSLLLVLLIMQTIMISCDSDPCDDGYTQVEGVCIPDYVVGIELNTELGRLFYHSNFGVIKFENGNWHDQNDDILIDLNE